MLTVEHGLERRLRMKIGLRILLGYFLIVAVAAWLLGRVFLQEVKPGVRQAMEDTLIETSTMLAELARDDMVAGTIANGRFAARVRAVTARDLGASIWGFSKRNVSTRIYVTDTRGIVVFDSSGRDVGKDYSRWNDVYLTLRGRYGARSTRTDPNDDATSVMHVAAPILVREGDRDRIVGVLTVAKPNQAIAPFIARSQGVILNWGFVLLGVALLVGLLAAWWLSRQLGALQRYAHAVTAGERISPPDAPGEFGDLGRALEIMRQKLEGKQYVEQYVHVLTHELKSPLAAIRGSAELLEHSGTGEPMPEADRVRFVASIRAQSERMAETIDKLLALAAVEHRQRIEQPQAVDLRVLADETTAQVASEYERRGLRLRILIPSDKVAVSGSAKAHDVCTISGDAFLLRQSLLNLLDNAADFAPRGSEVELALITQAGFRQAEIGQVDIGQPDIGQADRGCDTLRIEVRDRGPGVPDYALDRVFERFYSLPRPEGGSRSSGLGLCFVAEAAELHGGRVTLENRDGGGAIASLVLPISAVSAAS
jgi:two-component system, OmpR family, sensor histidine kinase CreC